jgi:CYTH domain-containing protein
MESVEIERKIILKYVPDIEYDEILDITQYYIKKKVWERFRKSVNQDGDITYVKTIKKTLRAGASLENEDEISEEEYERMVTMCKSGDFQSRVISKLRHIKYVEDDLKWEIDEFKDVTLVIAEIEIPTDDYEIKYPDYIKGTFIKDVTDWKEFNNRRMAEILFDKVIEFS